MLLGVTEAVASQDSIIVLSVSNKRCDVDFVSRPGAALVAPTLLHLSAGTASDSQCPLPHRVYTSHGPALYNRHTPCVPSGQLFVVFLPPPPLLLLLPTRSPRPRTSRGPCKSRTCDTQFLDKVYT